MYPSVGKYKEKTQFYGHEHSDINDIKFIRKKKRKKVKRKRNKKKTNISITILHNSRLTTVSGYPINTNNNKHKLQAIHSLLLTSLRFASITTDSMFS